MVSADVKSNIKQEMKDLVAASYKFCKKYLQNLKWNVKRACIFHLIMLGIPSILILSVKKKGMGEGGLLNEKNLLSVIKAICWQSLTRSARDAPEGKWVFGVEG